MPAAALDPELMGEVTDTMWLLADKGRMMICVTHEKGSAREALDRVACSHQAVMADNGPHARMFGASQTKHARKSLTKVG